MGHCDGGRCWAAMRGAVGCVLVGLALAPPASAAPPACSESGLGDPPPELLGPAFAWRQDRLSFVVYLYDAAEGATVAWDTDADGEFDDGTGTFRPLTFGVLGLHPVRVLVTDADGGTCVGEVDVLVENR